jgi:hypothetical protein
MTGSVNFFSLIAPVAQAPSISNRGRSLTSQGALDSDTFLNIISPFHVVMPQKNEITLNWLYSEGHASFLRTLGKPEKQLIRQLESAVY